MISKHHVRFIRRVRDEASAMSRYLFRSGVERFDVENEGVAYLLALPVRAVRGPEESVWVDIWPKIRRVMWGATRTPREISVELLTGGIEGDSGLWTDHGWMVSTATDKYAKASRAVRELRKRYEDIDGNRGVVKCAGGGFSAHLLIKGSKVVLGRAPDRASAASLQRMAIRNLIHEICSSDAMSISTDNRRLARRRTTVGFWVAVSRDSNPGTRALPAFFYGDPLEAILLMEWLSSYEADDSTPYRPERNLRTCNEVDRRGRKRISKCLEAA